jgi:hypothetical protein
LTCGNAVCAQCVYEHPPTAVVHEANAQVRAAIEGVRWLSLRRQVSQGSNLAVGTQENGP